MFEDAPRPKKRVCLVACTARCAKLCATEQTCGSMDEDVEAVAEVGLAVEEVVACSNRPSGVPLAEGHVSSPRGPAVLQPRADRTQRTVDLSEQPAAFPAFDDSRIANERDSGTPILATTVVRANRVPRHSPYATLNHRNRRGASQ